MYLISRISLQIFRFFLLPNHLTSSRCDFARLSLCVFQPFVDVIENEDVAAGKPVAQIRASDKDEASTLNARIQYTLDGEGAEKFMLEKESGRSSLLEHCASGLAMRGWKEEGVGGGWGGVIQATERG